MTQVLTVLPFSEQQIEPQANIEQEVIEISSDEESEDKVTIENKSLKKRTLSNSATGPPSKQQITLNTKIESLDSDDECLTVIKAIPTKTTTAVSNTVTRPVKVKSGAEKMVSSGNDSAVKGRDGRYIVTQKVKVDSIKNLQEVPVHWPIPPEGTNTAYIIDLNNDKKWQELDPNSKKKQLDRFIKKEVCPIFLCCRNCQSD